MGVPGAGEVFYDRLRCHSTLGQLSPIQYEKISLSQDLKEEQAA